MTDHNIVSFWVGHSRVREKHWKRTIFCPPGPLPWIKFSSISCSGGGLGRGGIAFFAAKAEVENTATAVCSGNRQGRMSCPPKNAQSMLYLVFAEIASSKPQCKSRLCHGRDRCRCSGSCRSVNNWIAQSHASLVEISCDTMHPGGAGADGPLNWARSIQSLDIDIEHSNKIKPLPDLSSIIQPELNTNTHNEGSPGHTLSKGDTRKDNGALQR